MAELFGDELGGIGVDRIGDLRHVALLHEDADHVDGALGHAVGQFLDRDRLRDRYFASDFFLRLVAVAGHALHATTERRDRALAHLVGGKCGHDGEPSAALFGASARRLGRRRRPRGRAPAGRTRSLVIIGFEGRARAGLRRCRGVGAEALLGDLVGLAFGFLVVLAADFFIEFAGFSRRAFGAIGFFAAAANASLFLGALTLFGFAQPRIGKCVGARVALVVSERAQHDAGGFRPGGRSGRRGRRYGRRRPGRSAGALWRCTAVRRGNGFRFHLARTGDAALYLLDHDRLAATVTEALAHHALLNATALQGQRLGWGNAQLLAAIFRRLSHSYPVPYPPIFASGSIWHRIAGLLAQITGPKPFQTL